MNLHWPFFHKPEPVAETAALRDRLIVAETQVMLLRDLVEHPRLRREPRKDKRSIQDAMRVTTERLERLFPEHVRSQRSTYDREGRG